MFWEIAIAQSLTSREVIWRHVPTKDLPVALGQVMLRTKVVMNGRKCPGILVTREDWTPEALKKKWFDTFYDITKSGAKRRRYRKTPIEKAWEEFYTDLRREKRAKKVLKNKDIAREIPEGTRKP